MVSAVTRVTQQHVFGVALPPAQAAARVQHGLAPGDRLVQRVHVHEHLRQAAARQQRLRPPLQTRLRFGRLLARRAARVLVSLFLFAVLCVISLLVSLTSALPFLFFPGFFLSFFHAFHHLVELLERLGRGFSLFLLLCLLVFTEWRVQVLSLNTLFHLKHTAFGKFPSCKIYIQ